MNQTIAPSGATNSSATLALANKITLGYGRVSTNRQDLSIEAQIEALKRDAEYRQTGPISLFIDSAVSGSVEFNEREQGKELLILAREQRAAGVNVTIITTKLDRLGRDAIDVNQTVRTFEEIGARIIFLDFNIDTSTPLGRFLLQIVAAIAQLEVERIKERIQTVLDHKRSHGMVIGTVPFGWDAVATGKTIEKGYGDARKVVAERKLINNPAEQQWIINAINWRSAGWNSYQIAKEFNLQGVKPKAGGKNWQSVQIDKMLDSKTVREWLKHRQDFSQPAETLSSVALAKEDETATDPELIQAL
jgi:DNA invertase Pin-like site-specific DNA recombinase